MIRVIPAHADLHLADVRRLFLEYAAELMIDLGLQGFDEELATLPGRYAPPAGAILLAREAERSVGCVALRPLQPGTCEMKRLYVIPQRRYAGIGRLLAEAIIANARDIGYDTMLLDTLDSMRPAIALYASMGFKPCPEYGYHPYPGTLAMRLNLKEAT